MFLFFAGLALAAYWPILPGDSTHIPGCLCGDQAWQTWLLSWTPYAIAHGHNPLFSTWTNYPVGVNLAQNTNMPLLAVIGAPITVLISPIASYNLLLWLAFPASAIAMYEVVRRWTGSRLAAILAGLLYGFSAYVVGQGYGHVMLSFVPLPPIYFYQLHKVVVRRSGRPYREGAALGLILVAQYLISAEIMVTLLLMTLIGMLLYFAADRHSITRDGLRYMAGGLAAAALVLVALLSYPLWFAVFGRQHFAEPVRGVDNPDHGLALGPILPTGAQAFSPLLWKYGHRLDPLSGQYLGIPLITLLALLVIWFRRNRAMILVVSLAVVAFVLSLGLHLGWLRPGRSIPLPFTLVARIPWLNNLLPARLSLYVALFVAVAIALGIAGLLTPTNPHRGEHPQVRQRRPARYRILGVAILVPLAIVALIPSWPYAAARSSVPYFFRSAQVKEVPVGSTILTYPFPQYPQNQAMAWQAVSGMRFKEVGTYCHPACCERTGDISAKFFAPNISTALSHLPGTSHGSHHRPPNPHGQTGGRYTYVHIDIPHQRRHNPGQ